MKGLLVCVFTVYSQAHPDIHISSLVSLTVNPYPCILPASTDTFPVGLTGALTQPRRADKVAKRTSRTRCRSDVRSTFKWSSLSRRRRPRDPPPPSTCRRDYSRGTSPLTSLHPSSSSFIYPALSHRPSKMMSSRSLNPSARNMASSSTA